jgi:hypothetical protein
MPDTIRHGMGGEGGSGEDGKEYACEMGLCLTGTSDGRKEGEG